MLNHPPEKLKKNLFFYAGQDRGMCAMWMPGMFWMILFTLEKYRSFSR